MYSGTKLGNFMYNAIFKTSVSLINHKIIFYILTYT